MKRGSLIWLVTGLLAAGLIYWISGNTYWADTKVPMPPKGEALVNPFYAAQRFAEALGARTAWDRVLTIPPASSVIVLSAWHWNLSTGRRERLQRWVESGGRLVVDRSLIGDNDEFERWSGIVREYRELNQAVFDELAKQAANGLCSRFTEERASTPATAPDASLYWLCDFDRLSWLSTTKTAAWALRDASGIQAMRVPVGRGSVTVINATPFRQRSLFDGDHGWLFVAATELRRDDDVRFLSEDDHPSILALIWQHGAPVVLLTLALLALALWRGSVRFGPLAVPPHTARRSLAEQIRGMGQFALHHGSAESLHAAAVRALHEAAQRRVPGYAGLSAKERAIALARLTGFERDALAAAIYHPRLRRSHQLPGTIALLETARRRTLIEHTRSSHGTY